ncbi:type VI secretion system baseplate subunit TssE [Arenibaculum pallidiluteum]|uniref:type VI secretion system baseplate subunit TssE n=1 Tax=Arenibaculum pallidiluteum TaxID=2812559 RepID=UPI001A9796B1|nr:type VI secretion system baseplate subunit TssE [Arenibaculum pallidiluteum]
MTQPKSLRGLAAPLFEKLTDLEPNSPVDERDLRFQTREVVLASIRREVSRLIDTRLPWQANDGVRSEDASRVDISKTVLRYGVPDMTHLCVRSRADRRQIERAVVDAIRTYEPRLINPAASLHVRPGGDAAHVEISGDVAFGNSLEPLSFSVGVELKVLGRVRKAAMAGDAEGTGVLTTA